MPTSKNPLNFLQKLPLQVVLVVPFLIEVVSIVGLVGYLSFINGQKAINDLVSQLQNEVSSRVNQHLDNLLATSPHINQINLDAYQLGILNLEDLDRTARYFYKQMQVFQAMGYINFGSIKGEFVGIGREDNGNLYLELMRASDGGKYKRYALDPEGKPLRVLTTTEYDFTEEGWYSNPVKAGKPVWSDIYNWADRPEIMSISSSYPVYDQNRKLIGVIGIDLILSQLNNFVQNLKASPSGKIFIVERDGLIVASSSTEKPFRIVNKEAKRLKVLDSEDPLIRATAQHLIDRFSNFNNISSPQKLDFHFNQNHYFLQVMPWQDKLGLNWLIVVAIPESDFTAQINANNRTTIQLCITALILAIVISILTTRWVTQPILRLSFAAKDLAQGKWNQTVDIDRADAVGQLAQSFNDMAAQLNHSFTQLNSVISQANQVGIKITASATQIAAAGKQLEATVTEQNASTNQVSDTAAYIAATSGELVKIMDNITEKAVATASIASNSQADLTEMATAMRQLAFATTSLSSRLGIMNEKANNINSVITTITKVSQQTNLLSLNAAIEAEKAGEFGAGFAVVAREIRRLADSTALATIDIEQIVKEIQISVAQGVTEMDDFSQEVHKHLERVNRIGSQIATAINQVQSLTPAFKEVSNRMEGQYEGAQQINIAITKLVKSSQTIVESLQDTNQAFDQLNETAQLLRQIISNSVPS